MTIALTDDDLDYRSNQNWKTSQGASTCQDSNGYVFPLSSSSFESFIVVAIGYLPEKDASGKDKWPRGEEKVWREGMRTIDKGEFTTFVFCLSSR